MSAVLTAVVLSSKARTARCLQGTRRELASVNLNAGHMNAWPVPMRVFRYPANRRQAMWQVKTWVPVPRA